MADRATAPSGATTKGERARPRERVIQLLYGSGGGGHLASAEAVAATLAGTPGVRTELVNASAIAGVLAGDALYNWFLSYNAVPLIEVLQSFASTFLPVASPALRASFRAHWASVPTPDAVVSFVPLLNRAIAQTLPKDVPFFTVLTDFSHGSHHWLQHPRQHVIAGTALAARQARAAGYRDHAASGVPALTATSGMVVHPRFYARLSPTERAERFGNMRLDPSLPTMLVLYGGSPPTGTVTALFEHLTARKGAEAVNVIIICGRNTTLLSRLESAVAERGIACVHIVGFSRDIPGLMQLSDVMIGKPGPGVVSEAFVSCVPVLLVTGENDSAVMSQEKDVVAWVRENGVGFVVRNALEAATITRNQMELMRENIRRLPKNRAVFEVHDLLQTCVSRRQTRRLQDLTTELGMTERKHVRDIGAH